MSQTGTCPEDVMMTAARCAECENQACVRACPEDVDLRAIFDFVVERMPAALTWSREAGKAEAFADEAISKSFG